MKPRRGLGAAPDPEREVDEEFAFHVDMRAGELEREGLSPEEARREALRAFGDASRSRSECVEIQRSLRARDRLSLVVVGFLADVGVAARGLLRRPGFSALAVLTLAVGIGAVTAIFSLVDATLLRPLPYPDSDRLVTVWETSPAQPRRSVAPANFVDWQARSGSITDWAALRVLERTLASGTRPQRLRTGSVTRDFFRTLAVEPRSGRTFDESLEIPAAVLGHGIWRRDFGGDPGVIGRTITLDESTYEVVGVAPEGFAYPRGVELWTWAPVDLPEAPGFPGTAEELRGLRDARFISVLGRLGPGVDRTAAQSEMETIMASLRTEYPVANLDAGVRLVGLQDYLVAGFRSTVLLLMGAVALVLVIACANVANLLLVRSIERRRELAVRAALGASGGRLLRNHLSEGLVLAFAGAVGGLGIGGALIEWAGRWSWVWGDTVLSLDLRVIALVSAVTGATAVAFGALPALMVRFTPSGALGGRGGEGGGDRGAVRARQALLALEVGLAFTLVLSTGLTVRTVMNLRAVDLGFEADRLATFRVFLPPDLSGPGERATALDEAMRAVGSDSGVESVAVAGEGPLAVGPWAGLRVDGRKVAPGEVPDVGWQFVSPDYFNTYGIAMTRGRVFTSADTDGAVPVAIINTTLAQTVFGEDDPIGERINTGLDGQGVWVEVVGVAADTRNGGPAEQPFPTLYRPLHQAAGRSALIAARLHGDPDAAQLTRLETAVRLALPGTPVTEVGSGTDLTAEFTRATRATLGVLGSLAAVALLLSAIGLYGVTSYAVTRRTRDLGVRLALGAKARSIVWLIVTESLRPCVLGLLVGLVASVAMAGGLRRMLFEVAPFDPVTVAAVGLVMTGVVVVASFVPAARAARLDPAETLRE